jgi:hypothetical protein
VIRSFAPNTREGTNIGIAAAAAVEPRNPRRDSVGRFVVDMISLLS